MTKIIDIEGIGPAYAKKLISDGIKTVEALLKMGATPKGREEISKATGISHKEILEWVNRADLYRIKGVGSEYSDLLENAGVDTVVELSKRDPKNLTKTMAEVNSKHKVVRRLPTEKEVSGWVSQAKKLPRVVSY
jgi:predicted flap endonuclease-1-like 5' DNA nuclease